MSATDYAAGAGRFVGASVQRKEDPRLLSGSGRYVDDIVLAQMVHAAFVRSPLAHAKITRIDASAAAAAPGVVAVFTGADVNGDVPRLWDWSTKDRPFPAVHPLADGDVRFVGDPVAIVIAESRYLAEDACELVEVDYEPLDAVIGRAHAEDGSSVVHPELGTNLAWSRTLDDGELASAFEACAHVFTETVHQHRHVNVPMEGRGLIADWQPGMEELIVYVSAQNPHMDRTFFARVLGLAENRVRVIMKDVGGGFGQKIFKTREDACVAIVSRRLARPVKWIEDRLENLMASNHARDEQMTVTFGVDDDGVILAAQTDYLGDVGAYPQLPAGALGMLSASMFPGPYRFQRYGWSGKTVYTNTCGLAPYRGPWMMETVAREIMVDIVARKLGIDAVEIRRRNVIADEDLPYTTPTQRVYDRVSIRATLEAAVAAIDYDAFRALQAQAREQGRYLGLGISTYVEPTAGGQGAASTEVATIRVEPTGKVSLLMGTGSHGHSLETTMVQVVADQLGLPIEDIVFFQGDTSISPFGGGTAGSRSAVAAGGAARLSAIKVREKVLAIAAHLMEAAPEDLELADGEVTVIGSPDSKLAFAEVAKIAYMAPGKLPEGMEPGLENTSRYAPPPATYANSTQICTCEVDVNTGRVQLLDFVVAEDCGVMINPMVVEGQIAGGVAQGIGGALLEHMAYDAAGNPLAITFKDYLLPTAADIPDIRYVHLETPSATPGGHKGVGEGGAIGAPPAVVNAVADALAPLGVKIIAQPLTPDRLLALIDEASGG